MCVKVWRNRRWVIKTGGIQIKRIYALVASIAHRRSADLAEETLDAWRRNIDAEFVASKLQVVALDRYERRHG